MWTSARWVRVWLLILAAYLFTSLFGVAFGASAASFTWLGVGGNNFSTIHDCAVSADGSTVVGTTGHPFLAFRWTAAEGMVTLGYLPDTWGSRAFDVSADGSTIVGMSVVLERPTPTRGSQAFRWTAAGGMVGLGDLPGGAFYSYANAVSADGSVIVGSSRIDGGRQLNKTELFRWTEESGMVGLCDGSCVGSYKQAHGISADGSIVVGRAQIATGIEAFRWTASTGIVGLGRLPSESWSPASYANAISADGRTIVGSSSSSATRSGREVFRWTAAGGMVGLGNLSAELHSDPRATSGDGSIVVGWSSAGGSDRERAWIWDARNGMRELYQVLTGRDRGPTGWTLNSALDVSADGRTIVGYGLNTSDRWDCWIATIPELIPQLIDIDIKPGNTLNPINPASRGVIPVAILGSDDFDVADVDVTTIAFGPEGAPILYRRDEHFRDVNGDGFTDVVSHYRTQETGIAQGDVEACISGMTFDGIKFRGCDSIKTFPACGLGFELALLLPGLMWLRKRRRVN